MAKAFMSEVEAASPLFVFNNLYPSDLTYRVVEIRDGRTVEVK